MGKDNGSCQWFHTNLLTGGGKRSKTPAEAGRR